ncbi:MAG: protein-glutamate O-methyltransferase CheR [Pirellulaceae bacterium]|nr:protein-glutamate O-methyltransferase CheR [Pirellulaceae bacterium]
MSTATLSSDALSFVSTLVRARSAIELDADKAYLIESRLAPLAKQQGYASSDEFVLGLKSKREANLERRLVEAMTTNETSFYRDIHPFEALRTHVLPELRQLRSKQRTLNIWSAACSSGQELYSIAMLLREHFPDVAAWNPGLLGTDLSEHILERAQSAIYSQIEVNRGLPAALLIKYFQREGMVWRLRPEVREMARFQKLNLIESWPPMPPLDVVFLRNVLIYFAPETKKQILQKVRRVMAPHAVLFLGAAETTLNLDASFERVQLGNCVFYRLK